MPDPLSAALATLRSRYGPEALRRGGMVEAPAVWPTAVPVLDGVLTPGGLPKGRITLLAATAGTGPSGRLTLLQSLTAMASRSSDTGYVDLAESLDPGFLADLGADLGACLVVSPGAGLWERGFVMARALVAAGMPWLGIALSVSAGRDGGRRRHSPGGAGAPRPSPAPLWEHQLMALAEAVARRGAVCVIATPAPVAAPLRHASSLTIACTAAGWQRAHGDVAGLRVRLVNAKSKLGAPGAEATVLLRYPRPYAVAEVLGLPSVVAPLLQTAGHRAEAV